MEKAKNQTLKMSNKSTLNSCKSQEEPYVIPHVYCLAFGGINQAHVAINRTP